MTNLALTFLVALICLLKLTNASGGIDLTQIVDKLKLIADPSIAIDWDNVGLMVEPSRKPHLVNKIMITNDLTEPVLDEAIRKGANMIISYHPVIAKSSGITRLTLANWKTRVLIKCIEIGIAVYSPHTTWDSYDGGMNDWMLKSFNFTSVEAVRPVKDFNQLTGFELDIRVDLHESVENSTVFRKLLRNKEIKFMGEMDLYKGYTSTQSGLVEAEFIATQQGFQDIVELIRKQQPSALKTLRSTLLEKPILKNVGLGRKITLTQPETLNSIVQRMKQVFNLPHLRFVLANGKTMDSMVSTIIVSAGSASETWSKFTKNTDLLICGELNHHELLQCAHDGMSVILTEHSNSERTFLADFKDIFKKQLDEMNKEANVDVILSEVDHDPVTYL